VTGRGLRYAAALTLILAQSLIAAWKAALWIKTDGRWMPVH
jgi:hypothetical protein